MQGVKAVNLALRFLLELGALGAWGYWGFQTGSGWAMKLLLGLGAPLLAAVVWGVFLAPASGTRLQGPLALLLEVVILGGAAVALAVAGRPALAVVFAVVTLINRLLMVLWGQ